MSTATLSPEQVRPEQIEDRAKTRQQRFYNLHRNSICVFVLMASDVLAIALSLRLATFLRAEWLPRVDTSVPPLAFTFRHYLGFSWMWLLLIVLLGVEGLYTQRRTLWNEIAHLTKATVLGLIVIFAAIAVVQRGALLSRATVLMTGLLLLMVLPTSRYWTKRGLGAAGLWKKRILVIGTTDTAQLALRGLSSDPVLGYEVVGLLDEDPSRRGTCIAVCGNKKVYVLGHLDDALRHIKRARAKDVLIALPNLEEGKLLNLVHQLQQRCESIYVVPQLWGLPMMNLRVDGFLRERLMMLKLSNNLAKPWNSWLKRMFDLALGSAIAVVALPLCLIVAALIQIDSGGPVLFIQERLGYKGARFRCIKFRTMHVRSDEMLMNHLAGDPAAAAEWHKYAKLREHDPRLTRLGRLLRRWSIDELPQLLNVLSGEMSLVGPRPYLPQERERIGVDLFTILSSRPGMTGFWQVSGRNQLTLDDRIQLEAWYVRNWTVWFDCIILAKTFRTVLFPQNGHELGSFTVLDGKFDSASHISSTKARSHSA
ncbi:MAG TPA: undecaprenyl-phosphate galactose phosphotransferase WbaP [Candidatus Acidoferrum sp.]|nr:undecaprenyl-phosphate galactose phosphotransferase WbaP [Candidatus Acidoferrum sp.]